MLEALAKNWGWLLMRAILAASYGVAAFAWSEMTLVRFVYLFGLYTVLDGMVALAIAIDVKALRGFGPVLPRPWLRWCCGASSRASGLSLSRARYR
jgi:uncharacterized membrane protein HdeD (DUF308 family)